MHDFLATLLYLFKQAIPFAAAGFAAGAAVIGVLYIVRRRKGLRVGLGQAAATVLLVCWIGGAVAVTFANRMNGMRGGIQYYPFLAFREAWNSFTLKVWLNPILNVAIFLPLGILLPLASKRFKHWAAVFAAGAGMSFIIEAAQYLLGRGCADLDDLICNTLGAMLGYCICMLPVSISERRRRPAAVYSILLLIAAAALPSVFLVYNLQPYGNLEDAPIYAASTRGVEWVCEFADASDSPETAGIYWTEPFTKESCDRFAAEFIGRLGADIDSEDADIQYYDNMAYYSDHSTYSLIVNYNDRSYEYRNYSVSSGEYGTASEGELRAALGALGVSIPDAAVFSSSGDGRYTFAADCVVSDGVLVDGTLECRVAENGEISDFDNLLSESILRSETGIISPAEAYDELRAGRFSWRDVAYFNSLSPEDRACDFLFARVSCGQQGVPSAGLFLHPLGRKRPLSPRRGILDNLCPGARGMIIPHK